MSHLKPCFEKYLSIAVIIFIYAISTPALAADRASFVGAWLNDDPYTEGITRVLITPSGVSDLDVHAFGKCYPIDCDWGTTTAAYSGNPFTAEYHFGYADVYLTLELLSATQLYVTAFYDYAPGDPRPDRTSYYYFNLMTQPDLVIHRVELPATVVDYGPYNWVTFYIQNLGAAGVSGPLRARIVDRERNGQPIATSGYMDLSYTSPIGIGEEVSHQFAIGQTGSSWTDGDYTFRIEADYENLIPEEIETNNLSLKISITVMEDYQLTGICRYNGTPMDWLTDVIPVAQLQYNIGGLIPGAEFRYYTNTGRYAINGVPADEMVFLNSYFLLNDTHSHYPGNYINGGSFDLSTMTPEERDNHDLAFSRSIHMTRPWDNTLFSTGSYPQHQPGIVFEWEPISGATEYLFAVDRYRSSSHPSGYGFIERMIEVYQAGTEYTAVLPVSGPDEHYQALIVAHNDASQSIGRMYRMIESGGYGFDYRFTVDYDCYTLPKLRMFITDMTNYEISGDIWNRYHVTITNLDAVPDALFESAPDLAPCGINDESSRTWVTFQDEDGGLLNSYCGVSSSADLNDLTFTVREGNPVPDAVKMVLEDRRCGQIHESILVDPTYPCPLGDLNGDCIVDLNDFVLFSSTWLAEGSILD